MTRIRVEEIEIDEFDLLEAIALDAEAKAGRVWRFVHQVDPPAELDTTLRAWVLQGFTTLDIVGAVTIAALRPHADQQRNLPYITGILRNSMINHDSQQEAIMAITEDTDRQKPWWRRWWRSEN